MSGLGGLIGAHNQTQHTFAVTQMVQALRHRGPDDADVATVHCDDHYIVLGCAQRDFSGDATARMPFTDIANGNRAMLDGAIHNAAMLRRDLTSQGHIFISKLDAEVALKAYATWGRECLHKLRGAFTLALWDAEQRELLLARDRVGEKPLVYTALPDGTFVFASEVRALLASALVPRKLDPSGVEVYLFNGFMVAPTTLIAGVKSLLPGHWLRVSTTGAIIQMERYWQLPKGTANLKMTPAQVAEQVDCVRGQLEESVIIRMNSPRQVGAYLSGGMDSSAVVAMMARRDAQVPTFGITFAEAEYDEAPYAKWVADKFKTKHTSVQLSSDQFVQWLPDAVAAMDSPTMDGVNAYCAARVAAEHGMTTLLSGVGGDELFTGYPNFDTQPPVAILKRIANRMLMGQHPGVGSIAPTAWFSKLATNTPAPLVKVIESLVCQPSRASGATKLVELFLDKRVGRDRDHLLRAYQALHIGLPRWTRQALMNGLSKDAARNTWLGLPDEFVSCFFDMVCEDTPEETVARMSLNVFMVERVLRDMDAVSSAVSVETLSPLTDHRLIEGTWQLPSEMRCDPSHTKEFAWHMFKPFLGTDFPRRKKQGFTFPFKKWLHEQRLRDLVQPVMHDEALITSMGLKPEAIAEVTQAFYTQKPPVHWSTFWTVFVLLDWCRENKVTL